MKKIILTYGTVLSVILMFVNYLYLFGHIAMAGSLILSFLPTIIILVIASKIYKRRKSSTPAFGEYFMLNAGIGIMVCLLFLLFNIGLANSISEDRKTAIVDNFVTQQIDMSRSFGVPEDILEGMEDEIYETQKSMFKIGTQISGMIIMVFFYLIIALIVSAILNKVLKT